MVWNIEDLKVGDLVYVRTYGLGASLNRGTVKKRTKTRITVGYGNGYEATFDLTGSEYPRPHRYSCGMRLIEPTQEIDDEYKLEQLRHRIYGNLQKISEIRGEIVGLLDPYESQVFAGILTEYLHKLQVRKEEKTKE
jgi:hypothetical protein